MSVMGPDEIPPVRLSHQYQHRIDNRTGIAHVNWANPYTHMHAIHRILAPRKGRDLNVENRGVHTFDFLLRQGSQANSVRPELRLGCGWRLEDIRRCLDRGEGRKMDEWRH